MRVARTHTPHAPSRIARPIRPRAALAVALALVLAGIAGALYAASASVLTVSLVPAASVPEGTVATFEVRLTDPVTEGPVTVEVTTQDGSGPTGAIAGSDYVAKSQTLTFEPGETVKTFDVTILDDAEDELNETFSVVATLVSVPTGATVNGSPAIAVAVIADNDSPNFVSLAGPSSPAPESGVAEFTITLDAASVQPVIFNYEVLTGPAPSATPGTDTAVTNGTWAIPAGSTSATVTVPLVDDNIPEEDEHFLVRITGAQNIANPADAIGQQAQATIADNDDASLSIADVTELESAGTFNFVVTLSPASERTVTVDYSTANGTAVAPDDYTATSGTLTFAPGETQKTIGVAIVDDSLDEADETFTVSLSNPSQAVIADADATGTIVDDDDAPTVSFTLATSNVGEGDGTASVVVQLSNASGQAVTVDYATANGTAVAPDDYTATSGTLTFSPGETQQTISVPIIDDTLDEDAETFSITLSNPSGATLGGQTTHTVTIDDNDDAPTVSFVSSTSNVGEDAGTASVVVQLSSASGQAVTVDYATANGTAVAPDDYTATSGTLTFAPGETQQTISVPIVNDTLDEDDETFSITLSNPSGATLGGQTTHTVTIDDDDAEPSVSFALATSSVGEGDGSVSVSVQLSAASSKTVTVGYSTANGTAVAPDDYTATSGTLTFNPGETQQTISVPIVNDTLDEDDETFSITLSNPSGATLGGQTTHTVTIDDNDAAPTVSFALATSNVGEDAGTASVVVELSTVSGRTVTVGYATANGTAVAPDDYTATSGTLTFAPGETQQTISVPIIDDTLDEDAETFSITLSNPSGATLGGQTTHTVTIDDDDAEPTVSFVSSTSNVGEDAGTASVVVQLSSASGQTVTVDYATANGTAVAPDDYTATSGTLTFNPGETQQTISVPIVNDTLDEDDETFSITLSNPSGATLGGQTTHTVTIDDDDNAPSVSFVSSTSSVGEGDGSVSVSVQLSAASSKTVTVDYATANGTAVAPDDYTATSGTLTFAPGETQKSFSVAINEDGYYEGDETFTVSLSNPSQAVIAGTDAVITITDNDDPPVVQFSTAASNVAESDGTAQVQVQIQLSSSIPSGQSVSVPYSVGGGSTATAGSDYQDASGTLTFDPGDTEKTISVTIINDTLDEDDETIVLTLGTPTGATLGSQTTHTITIIDDDAEPTVGFASPASSVGEGDSSAPVAVELSAPSGRTVTVNYATANGTAVAPDDYTATSGTLTFSPGETQKTISVTINDDAVSETSETVSLSLSSPVNAILGADTHTLTIHDNDGPPQVTFDLSSSSVGESDGTATVTVRLTQPAGASVSVDFAAHASSTAASPADYTFATASPLTFAPGETSKDITVNIVGNTSYQADRTLVIELSNVTSTVPGVGLGTYTLHTLTIEDDDGPSVSFTQASGTVSESAGSHSVTIALSDPVLPGDTVTVLLVASGTAASPADYSAPASVTFAAGESSKTITITIVDNQVDAPDKTVVLTLSPAPGSNVTVGAQGVYTLTITDDDSSPVAVDDSYSVDEDDELNVPAPGILDNDSDADGGPLTIVKLTDPAHGTLTLNANGSFSYVPSANYNGTDTFTYKLRDSGGNESAVATVTITVNPVNDAPVAVADSYSTPEDTELVVPAPGVLENDIDVDGDALTPEVVDEPQHGDLTLDADGALTYTPHAGFNGVDSFTYRVSDGTDVSEPVTVTIRVGMAYTVSFPMVNGNPGRPDLVGTFTLLPDSPSYTGDQQVLITVTVTNTGTAETTAGFWVDLYVNPRVPPSGPNMRWDQYCGIDPCRGIAWYVGRSLAPGESVTLVSLRGNYESSASMWDGRLPLGANSIYIYVDSWNPTVPYGAVQESDESNNRFGRTDFIVAGVAAMPKSSDAGLPPRPAVPR